MSKTILTLQDGTKITGRSFGATKETEGEVVFMTGMVGYPESFTDPSFKDQILVLTYPLVGNYGVPKEELDDDKLSRFFESAKIHLKGIIVSDYSEIYSHWNAEKSLSEWLREYDIPGITGIDTRALTKKLREKGCMLGRIHSEDAETNKEFYDPNQVNLVAKVSIETAETYGEGRKHIAIIDTGMKLNILRSFLERGVKVTRLPWNKNPFEYAEENDVKFDGIFFSNGPGDPTMVPETIEIMKDCFEKKIPTFGICLGSQIMGLAAGGKTKKLKYGHRSQNQPCIELATGRCYITSQNHGFVLDASKLPDDWEVSFENANDGTVEGVKHKKLPFFSVQFHPEAAPGPTDTAYLFDEFISML
ncbi:glutamine-hydrolyzing carbamoyl-phosphate synthase small subunit [Candidatus Peregrinibacteria bacterium]|jgi:carbamoyl-phosphate synthase small subunit|nr:glutamine-hydrolyzing carbamoyl-phosphate synthase small subunit [Candidatus Peregrinibacteria bacterium]MBT4631670.1 glutamine-hydrolyzing carbamoyl-phosphate synthase small subunit [Candidatus Peregrinibacteria bacterium]MBT5516798.1 glutamine-hydrolyzing carbamoyl-phosphate synthase small subunit [Candidatus Peregrinibacteria bacterium]MBT5823920.1 glutamine-hydrolyzing carbamoyl-phosphate synthase small subunit [Candidatus Peregrinibacteria bacterium]